MFVLCLVGVFLGGLKSQKQVLLLFLQRVHRCLEVVHVFLESKKQRLKYDNNKYNNMKI